MSSHQGPERWNERLAGHVGAVRDRVRAGFGVATAAVSARARAVASSLRRWRRVPVGSVKPWTVAVDRHAVVLGACISLAGVATLAQVVRLQLSPPQPLTRMGSQVVSARPIPSARGDLLDRRGRVLASTRFALAAFVDPTILPTDLDLHIGRLAEALAIDADALGATLHERVQTNRAAGWVHADESKEKRSAQQIRAELIALLGERLGLAQPQRPARPIGQQSTDVIDDGTASADVAQDPRLGRYVRLTGVLTPAQVAAVREVAFGKGRVPGVGLETIAVREYPAGALIAPIVGRLGRDANGTVGLERVLGGKLTGTDGRISYVRDAARRPLWIAPNALERAERGSNVRLSIDLELQRICEQHLRQGLDACDAAGGRLVLIDPHLGEVLAMVDIIRPVEHIGPFAWVDRPARGERPSPFVPGRYEVIHADPLRAIDPALGRQRNITDTYEPGSAFKPLVWAVITDAGAMVPAQMVDLRGAVSKGRFRRLINDVADAPERTWFDVLVYSSNIGMAKGALELTFQQLRAKLVLMGFGAPTGLELVGEVRGKMTGERQWSEYSQTAVSFGQEIAVTPVQMVRAFSMLARPGEWAGTVPSLSLLVRDEPAGVAGGVRVASPWAVLEARRALEQVALNMERKMGRRLKVEGQQVPAWRYRMFGKSGTAEIPIGQPPEGKVRPDGLTKGYLPDQYISSFVAGAPVKDPRLVAIVVVDDPGPEWVKRRLYYGSDVAGPIVRRVLEDALDYMGVEPDADGPPMAVPGSLAGAAAGNGAADGD